jgi:hypothetical protein
LTPLLLSLFTIVYNMSDPRHRGLRKLGTGTPRMRMTSHTTYAYDVSLLLATGGIMLFIY